MINITKRFNSKQFENAVKEVLTKKLSPKVQAEIKKSIKSTVAYAANKMFAESVEANCPTYEEETRYLVSGKDDRGRKVGVADGSRFIKEPDYMYLRDAVSRYAKFSIATSDSKNGFNMTFSLSEGSRNLINESIGFAWLKRVGPKNSKRITRRSTSDAEAYQPTWGFLLEKWEDGGSYTVRPRNAGDMLYPGPDNDPRKRTASKYVIKTIKPFQMFSRGMDQARSGVIEMALENLNTRFDT